MFNIILLDPRLYGVKPPYKTGLYGTETDGDVSKQNLRFLSCIFRLLLATVCTSKEEITELVAPN